MRRMRDDDVRSVQQWYPQIYLACHTRHPRAASSGVRLSGHDSSVLAHLDTREPMTAGRLARHLRVGASTLSATVQRLVRLGYIVRTRAERDARVADLRLTTAGARAMRASSVLDDARVAAVLGELSSEERRRALDGLSLLARASRALASRGAAPPASTAPPASAGSRGAAGAEASAAPRASAASRASATPRVSAASRGAAASPAPAVLRAPAGSAGSVAPRASVASRASAAPRGSAASRGAAALPAPAALRKSAASPASTPLPASRVSAALPASDASRGPAALAGPRVSAASPQTTSRSTSRSTSKSTSKSASSAAPARRRPRSSSR